jgi:hypothetical protein
MNITRKTIRNTRKTEGIPRKNKAETRKENRIAGIAFI